MNMKTFYYGNSKVYKTFFVLKIHRLLFKDFTCNYNLLLSITTLYSRKQTKGCKKWLIHKMYLQGW